MKTWFLLYGGQSEDGMGPSEYLGRTTDPDTAQKFYEAIKSNPYSTGRVLIVTDSKVEMAGLEAEIKDYA